MTISAEKCLEATIYYCYYIKSPRASRNITPHSGHHYPRYKAGHHAAASGIDVKVCCLEGAHLPVASLTRVLPQEPGRSEYYDQLFCLCGHLGGVSEIQTSLDVSD